MFKSVVSFVVGNYQGFLVLSPFFGFCFKRFLLFV